MTEAAKRILVVEDEAVVSMDIVASLGRLGYEVAGTAATGERAVEIAESTRPDLVLMDIHLQGEMDGIEAAGRIRASTHAPVVYLTAYSDDETLRRAKLTEPFGYAVKPFEERELHILIEIALRKHGLEERLRRSEELLSGVLRSITDAVVVMDEKGLVTYVNEPAERLTGWTAAEAKGQPLEAVADLRVGHDGPRLWDSLRPALQEQRHSRLGEHTTLRDRQGGSSPIEGILTPLVGEDGRSLGGVLALRDLTALERLDALTKEARYLRARFDARTRELV